MSKKSVIMCADNRYGCLVRFALPLTARMAHADHITGMTVKLSDPTRDLSTPPMLQPSAGLDLSQLTDSIRALSHSTPPENRLLVERQAPGCQRHATAATVAYCRCYADGTRSKGFDPKEASLLHQFHRQAYYELRYHIDVPVLVGRFDSVHPAKRLLPCSTR